MRTVLSNITQVEPNIGYTQNGASLPTKNAIALSVQCNVTVDTAAPIVFTASSATSIMTTGTAHGLVTGTVVQVSNSGGALPGGLSGSTNYYVIYISPTTFQLATSLANAKVGTYITLSSNGTGTQTVTATALAGASVTLQGSNDNVNWSTIGSAVSVSGSGCYGLSTTNVTFAYHSVLYTMTSGELTCSEVWFVQGEK